MTSRTVALSDLEQERLVDVLRNVVARDEVLTVELPEGKRVAIQPLPRLEPLPELEGFVPEGWKDAIYER
jgi:hypothetical protein